MLCIRGCFCFRLWESRWHFWTFLGSGRVLKKRRLILCTTFREYGDRTSVEITWTRIVNGTFCAGHDSILVEDGGVMTSFDPLRGIRCGPKIKCWIYEIF